MHEQTSHFIAKPGGFVRFQQADIVSAFRGEQENDTSQGVVDRISSLFSPLLRPKDGDDAKKQ